MELFNGINFNLEHHGARLQTSKKKKKSFQTKFHANLLQFYFCCTIFQEAIKEQNLGI